MVMWPFHLSAKRYVNDSYFIEVLLVLTLDIC